MLQVRVKMGRSYYFTIVINQMNIHKLYLLIRWMVSLLCIKEISTGEWKGIFHLINNRVRVASLCLVLPCSCPAPSFRKVAEYQIGQFSPKLRVLMVELNVFIIKNILCNYIFYISNQNSENSIFSILEKTGVLLYSERGTITEEADPD